MSRHPLVITTIVAFLGTVACSRDAKPRAPADAIPPSTNVDAATVTEGTVHSRLRRDRAVEAFRVTTTPITVSQYRRCVDVGWCSAPAVNVGTCADVVGIDGATYVVPGGDALPVTCVRASQAREFCDWVGGRLPRVSEWELAARGRDVHRHAWGESSPTCETSARLNFSSTSDADECCKDGCDETAASAVLKHPAGASPSGVVDVLLTRAEIAEAEDGALIPACSPENGGCAVTGGAPGEIGHWVPLAESPSAPVDEALSAAGFRCAWNGGAQ